MIYDHRISHSPSLRTTRFREKTYINRLFDCAAGALSSIGEQQNNVLRRHVALPRDFPQEIWIRGIGIDVAVAKEKRLRALSQGVRGVGDSSGRGNRKNSEERKGEVNQTHVWNIGGRYQGELNDMEISFFFFCFS